jgi:hypothetical protein
MLGYQKLGIWSWMPPYAEAFELCEYGSQPSDEELKRLFPFFGD